MDARVGFVLGRGRGAVMMTSTVMETIYRKIEAEGVWLVDPKQTNYEQQQAILALRKAGRIEQAAYGGLKIKRDWRVKPAPDVRALLVSAGVDPAHIRDVKPTTGAWLRPGNGTQYTVAMDRAGRLAGTNVRALSDDIIANGSLVIIRLKIA